MAKLAQPGNQEKRKLPQPDATVQKGPTIKGADRGHRAHFLKSATNLQLT